MTTPLGDAGGDRDRRDGSDEWDDEWDDDWVTVSEEEVRGPVLAPPPPDTAGPGVRCPGCAALVPSGTSRCPRCLAPIGNGGGGGGGDENGNGGAVPVGARVVLHFDTLALSLPVRPGEPLRLGRDADWAPASAGALKDLATVSRRHASVTVDPDGTVWVAEETDGTLNGTWVNDGHLLPGERHRLRHGDRVRLGLRVGCTVRITGDGPC
ncbi:FHA domain-containing protein [Streptomyces sp. ML-6]|uniref:FHA domain-containing protein n=1 Tax=Streptomyces sp. ML-6 TaxID=2982693 RepID=UPI0024BF4E27|nr:FHA domain-containing protein [Streptomyces sp. ML-6]MDK0520678.1 FHA domain-containing protein [Streptomyces sp. ML-6]